METLSEFTSRTGSFNRTSLPLNSHMQTNPNLSAKIDENGKMRKFYGNTVIFSLPSDFIKKAEAIQKKLYKTCGEFLAEPINTATFHITLHDLVNGSPSEEIDSAIKDTEARAMELVRSIKQEDFHIKLKTTYLFNMVNTAVVLGFEPVDEYSHNKLMEYYALFNEVVHLNYPLTPHMTFAYYKPDTISEEQVQNLQGIIDYVSAQNPETIELTGDMLSYMVFYDMNTYVNQSL